MKKSYPTDLTEAVAKEDWCARCEQWVARWQVSFEVSSDAEGYDKIRRCPHCNAKCFADDSDDAGWLLAFSSFVVFPVITYALLKSCGVDPESNAFSTSVALAGLVAAFVSPSVGVWFWRRLHYRNKPVSMDTEMVSNGTPKAAKEDE